MKSAQAHAARAVAQVLRGRTLDAALARAAVHPLEGSERALAHELSYGTLRHLGRLRAIARGLVAKPVVNLELDALLCVTLYQLQHGHASPHSVVSNAVDAARMLRLTSAKGLVNAVLRKYLRERAAIDAAATNVAGVNPAENNVDATDATSTSVALSDEERFSYPQWWIDRVRAEWPESWRDILDAGNQRPPLTLRVNRRRTTRDSAVAALRDAGLACHPIGDDGVMSRKGMTLTELLAPLRQKYFISGEINTKMPDMQLVAEKMSMCHAMLPSCRDSPRACYRSRTMARSSRLSSSMRATACVCSMRAPRPEARRRTSSSPATAP